MKIRNRIPIEITSVEAVRRSAWFILGRTARSRRVILQVGYLIDAAATVHEVLAALAMIGEFEIEEQAAAEEHELNELVVLSA